MGQSYLIVGCGVFGLTTALSLSKGDASCTITMVDRYEPPVPDGASVDSSRIIRTDYADPLYAKLAKEARVHWREDPELNKAYHETGMLLNTADSAGERGYLDKCIGNVKSLGIEVVELAGDDLMRHITREVPEQSRGLGLRGYLNPVSGFADSRMGIEILYRRAKLRGNIHFLIDEVAELQYDDRPPTSASASSSSCTSTTTTTTRRVIGVRTKSGNQVLADTTILATGAWQLPDVPIPSVATGQVIGYLELTEEEEATRKYADMPVTINFATGWFCIPPYKGHLKVARHAEGYLNTTAVVKSDGTLRRISVPRTSMTHGGATGDQQIPQEGERALREGMRTYLPDLADRPFAQTRVCWYTDTPLADFLIDRYPEAPGLFVATGGSGHAYKFLPILGDLVVSVLNGTADASLRRKWSFAEALAAQQAGIKGDGSRGKGKLLEWAEVA